MTFQERQGSIFADLPPKPADEQAEAERKARYETQPAPPDEPVPATLTPEQVEKAEASGRLLRWSPEDGREVGLALARKVFGDDAVDNAIVEAGGPEGERAEEEAEEIAIGRLQDRVPVTVLPIGVTPDGQEIELTEDEVEGVIAASTEGKLYPVERDGKTIDVCGVKGAAAAPEPDLDYSAAAEIATEQLVTGERPEEGKPAKKKKGGGGKKKGPKATETEAAGALAPEAE
jgi:hypothetical protein